MLYKQAKERPNGEFLGTRTKNSDGSYGEYTWKTFGEVLDITESIAKGIKELNFCPIQEQVTEDGRDWSFAGIWSKNRWEWNAVHLACQMVRATVVGFYDTMGPDAV